MRSLSLEAVAYGCPLWWAAGRRPKSLQRKSKDPRAAHGSGTLLCAKEAQGIGAECLRRAKKDEKHQEKQGFQ